MTPHGPRTVRAANSSIDQTACVSWTTRDTLRSVDEQLSRHTLDWAKSGDPAARARLISDQLRAGSIARARVELAAWLGDAASRVAIGAPERAGGDLDFERWTRGLEAHGREVAVRAALAATRHAVTEVGLEAAGALVVTSTLETVERWLACPCNEHVAAAVDASRRGPNEPYPANLLMSDGELDSAPWRVLGEPAAYGDAISTFAVALARCTAALIADRERRLEGLDTWNDVEWLFLGSRLTAARIMTRAAEVVRCRSGAARDVENSIRRHVSDALIMWSLDVL